MQGSRTRDIEKPRLRDLSSPGAGDYYLIESLTSPFRAAERKTPITEPLKEPIMHSTTFVAFDAEEGLCARYIYT